MMINLFSIFDPMNNIMNFSLNWISSLLCLLFFPIMFWLIPNRSLLMINLISKMLHQEFKILLGKNSFNGTTFLFLSIFFTILLNNLMGLFPYTFTSTSHMVQSISISLTLWMTLMLYGWINNTNHMFTHLIPMNTPMMLTSFMALIETISNFIRPGTLSIRLTANMIAGHLLLTLLSSMSNHLMWYMILFLLLTQILLLILEIAVAIIQSYVFATLSNLYSSEIN
uniref:ATP synthase subunit a n=1 Tax=Orthotrichia sp. XG-2021 TaxID=2996738 RepID=A0A9E8RUV4_9NEOP|nr:ATP synthase F0 subunit 6 [Orthotrichia sp. XG-2021]